MVGYTSQIRRNMVINVDNALQYVIVGPYITNITCAQFELQPYSVNTIDIDNKSSNDSDKDDPKDN